MGAPRAFAAFLCVVSSSGGCFLTSSLSGLTGGADAGINDAAPTNEAGANDGGNGPANDGGNGPANDAATPDGGGSAYAAAVLVDKPVLYWRLGEKDTTHAAHDSSKGRRDGTFVGAVQCGVDGAIRGDTDTACRFDGTTSAVSVDAAGLAFAENGSYSIEAWVRPTSVTADHPVFSIAGHDVQNDGYLLLVDNNARLGNVRETSDGLVGATGPATPLGAYVYVVGVYDGGTLRLYVNGEPSASSAAASPIPGAASIPFTAGADGSGHGQPFIGDIDEVAAYDHALSADQVRTHYQAANAGP